MGGDGDVADEAGVAIDTREIGGALVVADDGEDGT